MRVREGPPVVSAARLAERIGERLARGPESITATFREVIQFIDDGHEVTEEEARAVLLPVPASTSDQRWDAVVAGAADWVASIHGLPSPSWTQSEGRKVASPGWVVTRYVGLHELVRANTPDEFARHGVYVDRASLVSY